MKFESACEGHDDSIRWQQLPVYHNRGPMLKERWALRICKLNFVACLTELVTITVTSLRGERGRKGSLVAVLYADWTLGWYLLGGMLQPKLTSRGVIWFLVECQVISRMLLDESRGEHNSPCVNSTTTSMTSAQKVMGGGVGSCVLTSQMVLHHGAMFTHEKSSNRIKQDRNSQ